MTPELDSSLREIIESPGMRAFGWTVLVLTCCAIVLGAVLT